MDVMAVADFLNVEVWTKRGLVRFHVLFVMSLAKRKVEIAHVGCQVNGGAVFRGSEIQKIFLDVHTARAHVANNPTSFGRNYGAMQLGVENTDFFV